MSAVTLSNGTVITDQMSPQDRHNAVAASLNLPTVAKVDGRTGPPLHVHADHTGGGVANVDAAAAKAAPSPKQLARQNSIDAEMHAAFGVKPQGNPSAVRQAELDREQQAAGIQTRPDGRRIAVGEVDQEAIDLVTAHYRNIAGGMRDRPETAARFKAAYENDVRQILDGKQLTGAQIAALKKGAGGGNIETFVPRDKGTPAAASQFTPAQWAEGHKSVVNEHGMMPVARINPKGLSGYTLPKVIADQHYGPEIFGLLEDARAEGLSQKQVDGMIRAEMKRTGWVKN